MRPLTGPPLPSGNQVSDLARFLPSLKLFCKTKHEHFQAGNIKWKMNNWKQLTSDSDILETVNGIKIEFIDNPHNVREKTQRPFSVNENAAVDNEVRNLLRKGVISESPFETGQVVSPIFVREKKDA